MGRGYIEIILLVILKMSHPYSKRALHLQNVLDQSKISLPGLYYLSFLNIYVREKVQQENYWYHFNILLYWEKVITSPKYAP